MSDRAFDDLVPTVPADNVIDTRFPVALTLLVVLSAMRFLYAVSVSPATWQGTTYMELVYDQQTSRAASSSQLSVRDDTLKRKWGPVFIAVMSGLERLPIDRPSLGLLLRVSLTLIYLATALLLARLFFDVAWPWSSMETLARTALLLVLCFQSSAAIYAIANGMGEIVTAFSVVGHFYLFSKRRFAAAAWLVMFGVYFKLYPVVFAFPYLLFSMLSSRHRRYCLHLFTSGLVIALLSVPVAGWRFGFFYPMSIVGSVVTDTDVVPILSKEVFGPVSLVARAASAFRVRAVDARALAIARTLSPMFSVLLVLTTALAATVLWRMERRWDKDRLSRTVALLLFQGTIGFLMFAFSMDMSITLLLPMMISLFAPLWLWMEPLGGTRRPGTGATAILFALGSIAIGNLIPLSWLFRILPLAWLDRIAGNAPGELIDLEKYIWYDIPLVGVVLLALAFCRCIPTIPRADRESAA